MPVIRSHLHTVQLQPHPPIIASNGDMTAPTQ